MMGPPALPSPLDSDLLAPALSERELRVRFWVGGLLTLPLVAFAFAHYLVPLGIPMPGRPIRNYVQLVLATPIVFWCGWPFFLQGWVALSRFSANMFTLVALGVGAGYAYSALVTLAPEAFPWGSRDENYVVNPFYETVALITLCVLFGQLLESRARRKSHSALHHLLRLVPATALRLAPDGSETEVPLDQVQPGDLLRLRAGATLPADGVVVEG